MGKKVKLFPACFMVRLTESDRQLIGLLSERLGENKSAVVRQAVRMLAKREKLRAKE